MLVVVRLIYVTSMLHRMYVSVTHKDLPGMMRLLVCHRDIVFVGMRRYCLLHSKTCLIIFLFFELVFAIVIVVFISNSLKHL